MSFLNSRVTAALVVVGAVTLTGCKADVGTDDHITGDQIEKAAASKFASHFSQQPTYDCPEDVTKDPGKKTTCTVTDKGTGQKFDMVVVVKDDGGGIDMNIPKLPVIGAPRT